MITHKTVEKKRNQKIGVKMMKTDIEIAQEAELKTYYRSSRIIGYDNG